MKIFFFTLIVLVTCFQSLSQEIRYGYYINQDESKDIEILTMKEAAEVLEDLMDDPAAKKSEFLFFAC